MTRVLLASPSGMRSGFYAATNGSDHLLAIVVPKFWSAESRHYELMWSPEGGELVFAVAEGDTVSVKGSAEQLALFDQLGQRSAKSTTLPPLFVRASSGRLLNLSSLTDVMAPQDALLGLELLMTRMSNGSLFEIQGIGLSPQFGSRLLRPLVARAFVAAVEKVISSVRRGYVWSEDSLPYVRGRPDPLSIEVSRSTGWPNIRCSFEEFSRETPLMVSMSTALRQVVLEPEQAAAWADLSRDTRNRAVRLRRLIPDVPGVSVLKARQILSNLRLTPLESHWSGAVNLARLVLHTTSGLSPAVGAADSVEVQVDTSRLWELCVLRVLQHAGVEDLVDGNDVSPPVDWKFERPWQELGTRSPAPDIIWRHHGLAFVADAKYKRVVDSPAIDDLYQLFAYSHLSSGPGLEPKPVDLTIFYPCSDTRGRHNGPYHRSTDSGARLWLRWVPFPRLVDLRDHWQVFLEGCGESLAADLHAAAKI